MAPVELLLVVSAERTRRAQLGSKTPRAGKGWHELLKKGRHVRERVDHGSDRRLVPGAHVVKVHHALHGPGLHAPHDGLGVFAEEGRCLGYREKTKTLHIDTKYTVT